MTHTALELPYAHSGEDQTLGPSERADSRPTRQFRVKLGIEGRFLFHRARRGSIAGNGRILETCLRLHGQLDGVHSEFVQDSGKRIPENWRPPEIAASAAQERPQLNSEKRRTVERTSGGTSPSQRSGKGTGQAAHHAQAQNYHGDEREDEINIQIAHRLSEAPSMQPQAGRGAKPADAELE